MKLKIERSSLLIIPEDDIDRAYIEDTLGLKEKGQSISLVRVSPMGLDHAIAFLKTKSRVE